MVLLPWKVVGEKKKYRRDCVPGLVEKGRGGFFVIFSCIPIRSSAYIFTVAPPPLLSLDLFLHQILPAPILLNLLRPIRSRNLNRLDRPRVRDAPQPTHRPQNRRVDNVLLRINRILPHPEPHPLDNRQHPRLLPRRRPTLKLLRADQFPLDREHGFFDPRAFHCGACGGSEAAERPFAHAIGRVDGGRVGGFEKVLGDDVDGAFLGGGEVSERVFGVGEAAGETDGEKGGVVVYDLGVGERREVC